MMLAARGAIRASGAGLPYDAEVEFLESDGSQFIKVPGKISSTSRITVTFKYTGATFSQFAPFGGGDGNLIYEASLISDVTPTGKWIYRCNNRQNLNVVNLDISQVHTVTWYKDGAVLDGVDYPSLTTTSNFTPTRDYFGLFANLRNGDNSPIFTMRGYIMSAQVYDNGTLIRDFIPVRKKTVGYLYDRVSGKLFGNAGTGDFVLGPDVVPVEYIESHGTEWINTGIVPTADDSFYCRAKQSSIRDQCLWGLAGVAYCFSNWAGGSSGNGTYWGHPAIGTGGVNNVNPLGDTNWHEILCQPSGVFVDGTQINTQVTAPAQSPQNTVALFARSVNSARGGVAKNGWGRMSAFRIERNGDLLRKYLSVRVGIEGAMMDVLTRRIYRNAGTGAFTYGNDLKYPIPA